MYPTVISALSALARGETTSIELVSDCLARIADTGGEGSRAFLSVAADRARAEAEAQDALRASGAAGPLSGVPVGIKDIFDLAGEITTAGSRVLGNALPATADSPAVARLRVAGAVVLGRNHMNEFAYSAMGWNPHYPAPRGPWDRSADNAAGRAPGGSSSGGAVAVADGMICAALGSDTGGSTRIPAAFCGLTGFKPSPGRIPLTGVFPLATSFDTVGPIAHTVADCRLIDAVLSGCQAPARLRSPGHITLALPDGLPFQDLDPIVAEAIKAALARLRAAGVALSSLAGLDWDAPGAALRAGQVTAVEAIVNHGAIYARRADYDPRVAKRMAAGEAIPATAYVAALTRIATLRDEFDLATGGADAVLMPTVAILPPRMAELDDEAQFFSYNSIALRNTMIANILARPAISLPIPAAQGAPVGLMLMGDRNSDHALFDTAATIERCLKS
jgi:aspartyl-tRNA(Asn)/glutamyl-tRNA(Gln) amidotransferase subunit A